MRISAKSDHLGVAALKGDADLLVDVEALHEHAMLGRRILVETIEHLVCEALHKPFRVEYVEI